MNKKSIPLWIGEENFEAEVMIREQVVLVAFLASWSKPCQVMDFTVDKVSVACAGRVKVVKVNADEHPALSLLYDIQSIPTLLYFSEGILRERTVGTVESEVVLSELLALLRPNSSRPLVSENGPSK